MHQIMRIRPSEITCQKLGIHHNQTMETIKEHVKTFTRRSLGALLAAALLGGLLTATSSSTVYATTPCAPLCDRCIQIKELEEIVIPACERELNNTRLTRL